MIKDALLEIVLPIMKILSLFIHPHIVPKLFQCPSSAEH